MKKSTFMISFFISFCMILSAGFWKTNTAYGSVPYKDCDACHVLYPGMMGKSKEKGRGKDKDKVMVMDAEKDVQSILCANCHTNTSADTIKTVGANRIPVVNNTQSPQDPLAGGNFYYVVNIAPDRGHNVDGIAKMDTKHKVPPGYDRLLDPSIIGYNPSKPLTCAGSNGCHGDRNKEDPFSAIMGSHHADDQPTDGSTSAKSYRYLKITGTLKGVVGFEDDDWGQHSSSSSHNEYSVSINKLCASCHGEIHGGDISKPWFRHPVGVVLPERKEYRNYTTYNINAPIGRPAVTGAPNSTVKPGTDIIVCTSCHVAHASPYESALRWDFKAVISAKGGNNAARGGCFICHTKK